MIILRATLKEVVVISNMVKDDQKLVTGPQSGIELMLLHPEGLAVFPSANREEWPPSIIPWANLKQVVPDPREWAGMRSAKEIVACRFPLPPPPPPELPPDHPLNKGFAPDPQPAGPLPAPPRVIVPDPPPESPGSGTGTDSTSDVTTAELSPGDVATAEALIPPEPKPTTKPKDKSAKRRGRPPKRRK